VPNLDNEKTVSLDNFEETFHNLWLPFKLTFPENKGYSKEFIKYRLEHFPNGMPEIQMEDYRELYEHLNEEKRKKVQDNISLILLYYNRILRKSLFCPSGISLEGELF